jgi:hypothetical protein
MDALVGITNEITRYELSRCGNPQIPHITIGNGFDVQSVPERQAPLFSGTELDLLFVAHIGAWHGLDRLLKGMSDYRGLVKIHLYIAGDGEVLSRLKVMVRDLGIQDQVFFVGFTSGKDLDSLFNHCHIAVGSLGLHQLGLHEASTLKLREYCSRGIPFIYECADPDFPEDFPYSYIIPSDDSQLSISTVITFISCIYEDPTHPRKMREYAQRHLEWSEKMGQLKNFLLQRM